MPDTPPVPPLRLFLSYSHHDEDLCDRFTVHLSQLKREGLIAPWSDRLITAGKDWAGAIDENLNSAHIIVLLVSPDFLASDYINDIEMDRAMQRHQKGEAVVVPLILKPADWQTSRFARLQAIPKNAKPVIDWPTPDHGFEDAVLRLRQMIREICNPAPLPVRVVRSVVSRHPWPWALGTVVAVALLVGGWLWSNSQRYFKQGADLLNVGRYQAARPWLEQARKWNPLSRAAGCGLLAADLDAARSDQVGFERRLDEATRQYPRCAYLKVLSGEHEYDLGKQQANYDESLPYYKQALSDYKDAAKLRPGLAEAYFDMGRVLDVMGDPDGALDPYLQAVKLSPGTPAYHNNLADLYFRREDYDKAIAEYGVVANLPLSALLAAKIYRLQNKLDLAAAREEDAIACLKQLDICLKEPDEQRAEQTQDWVLDISPTREVRLVGPAEKQCYAELELAVTKFLQDDDSLATQTVPSTIGHSGLCHSRRQELTDILKWELRRLGNEVPQFTNASDAFVSKFLN